MQENVGAKKKEASQESAFANQNFEKVNANDMYNAMNLMGLQNAAFISKNAGVNDVESASNYLGEERISDIEAMMAEFENGVNNIADIIDDEFGGMFSESEKNALAAKIFAQE